METGWLCSLWIPSVSKIIELSLAEDLFRVGVMEADWGVSDGEASPYRGSSLAQVFSIHAGSQFGSSSGEPHCSAKHHTDSETPTYSKASSAAIGQQWLSVLGSVEMHQVAQPKWIWKELSLASLISLQESKWSGFCWVWTFPSYSRGTLKDALRMKITLFARFGDEQSTSTPYLQ